MGLSLCQWPTCRCCRQLVIDDERRMSDTAFDLSFFGCAAYAICPVCFQEVDQDTLADRNYRRRAQRVHVRKEGKVAA